MSKNKQFISITPPIFVNESGGMESLNSPGHKCSLCRGNGWSWGEEERERVKITCPACKGSGKLDAIITIEWKPAK